MQNESQQPSGSTTEWQPARVFPAHGTSADWTKEQMDKAQATIVHIREVKRIDMVVIPEGYEKCSRFFEVKETPMGIPGQLFVCEHEVLTD